MKRLAFIAILAIASLARAAKVDFDDRGYFRIDGKPFFPIGCWCYSMDAAVIADLHEHHFNTVVRWGFKPDDIKVFEKHGLMAIPPATEEFLKLKDSPSVLAWYLEDEPEEHDVAVEKLKHAYAATKAKDADHPIGITHDMLIGPAKFDGCSDFTMTDVYPVTADRQWPMNAVGTYTDEPRRVHGKSWPNLTFVQTFGGPDSDGGKWAQPLPHEVRFMAFNALVHRANGILYFSYWPRAAATWASIAQLNRDIERIVPWLIAAGEEFTPPPAPPASPPPAPRARVDPAIEMRARKVGQSWIVIVTNITPGSIDATIDIPPIGDATLAMPFENGRTVAAKSGAWRDRLDAYEAKVYTVGAEPAPPPRNE